MKRDRWRPFVNLSFRTKLIISNAILASAIMISMAYYLISRAAANNDFLSEKLTQAVQDATENELRVSATRFAGELNQTIGLMLTQIEMTKSVLQIGMTNADTYPPIAESSLTRSSQGNWINAGSEPGSIFIPGQQKIPEAVLTEISVIRQIDLIVPSIMEKSPDVLAIYFGSVLGETLHYPNDNFAASLSPDFDVTQQPWFMNAAPDANSARKTICSDPYRTPDGKPVVTCSTPVFDEKDHFRGVVAMDIHLG